MPRPARMLAGVLAVAALAAGAACGDEASADAGTAANQIEQLPADLLPAEVAGLQVTHEDMSEPLDRKSRTYISELGLWSFRRDDLVQATLQVNRYNDEARPDDPDFRRTLLQQIGGTALQETQVGDRTVYLTGSTRQALVIFFTDDAFSVLAIREDFEKPRTLVRDVLELDL